MCAYDKIMMRHGSKHNMEERLKNQHKSCDMEDMMNTATLTIDDFSSKNTPAIVDYLQEKGIKPIFLRPDRMWSIIMRKRSMLSGRE